MADPMRIGELESRSGTPASTIRYYERIGVLPTPQRVNGQRRYGEQALDDLEAVHIGQGLGFSLDEIKALLREFREGGQPSQECRGLAERKLAELDELVDNARKMQGILEHGMSCSCSSLSGCYLTQARDPA